jgi:hypothetical protein
MPYALEAVFLTYFMFTLWLGLRVQRAWWLRITGAGPELPKQPGAVDFAAPTTLIDGRPHRARAAPDFSIAAWEPIPDARDAKVVRS